MMEAARRAWGRPVHRHLYARALWVAGALALLALWELYARHHPITHFILPGPSRIAAAMGRMLEDPVFWRHFRVTLVELILGIAVGAAAGLGVGVIVGARRYLREVFEPLIIGLFSAPKIAFLPLFLLIFGIDTMQKVMFGAFHGFFVVAVNVIGGLQEVDRDLILLSRSMGASKRDIWIKVLVPSIVPMIFAGLRLGVGLTFLGVLVAELAVSRAGLGFMLNRASDIGNVAQLFALILLIGASAMIVNQALSTYEGRLIRWKHTT